MQERLLDDEGREGEREGGEPSTDGSMTYVSRGSSRRVPQMSADDEEEVLLSLYDEDGLTSNTQGNGGLVQRRDRGRGSREGGSGLGRVLRLSPAENSVLGGETYSRIDDDEDDEFGQKTWCGGYCTLRLAMKTTAGMAFGVVLTLSLIFFVVAPQFAQYAMDQSTLSVIKMHMKNPTNTTIVLNATCELHDAGMFPASIMGEEVEIVHDEVVLATMFLPKVDIVASGPTSFDMEETLTIRNVSAFTKATAKILQGIGGVWYIRGKVHLHMSLLGIARELTANMNKELLIPATLLENVRGYGTDLVPGSSTNNSFAMTARTSFFSSSVLELWNLGEFVFALERDNVKIGEVVMDDFDLRQGHNDLPVHGRVILTEDNEELLSDFVSKFLIGNAQEVELKGPIASASPFLNHVVKQTFTFGGLENHDVIKYSFVDEKTEAGFSTKLPDGKTVHYRGTIVAVQNPFGATVGQTEIITDVYALEPIGYELDHPLFGKHHCETTDKISRLFTAPGMFKDDPGRPPIIELKPYETVSFFMPGIPIPSQGKKKPPCKIDGLIKPAGDLDCCFISLQTALACRAQASGRHHFAARVNGTFVQILGDLRLKVRVSQQDAKTVFADTIPNGNLGDAELSCRHIKFL